MVNLRTNYLPQSPCKDCMPPVRHEGCHSECPLYIDYEEKAEQARNCVKEKKGAYTEYVSYRRSRNQLQKRPK